MVSIYPEERPTKQGTSYRAVWRELGDPRRRTRDFGRYKHLRDSFIVDKREELLAQQLGLKAPLRATSWGELAEIYLVHSKRHKAFRTYRNFEKPAIDGFSDHVGKNRPLVAVTSGDVAAWEEKLFGAGYHPNTVHMRLRVLRTALRFAARERLLEHMPSVHLPTEEPAGRALTDEELARLLPLLTPELARVVRFLLYTGLRRGELLALEWRSIREVTEKGESWVEAEIGGVGGPQTKTRQSRVIVLPGEAVVALGPRGEGRVFSLSETTLSHGLRDASRAAGLGRIRAHDLRHTWATRFMQENGDLFALMAAGGWTSLPSVKRYQHQTGTRARAGMRVTYTLPPPNF